MFPDFIIIGGMKCGTSSLYHYLSLHPEVGMSQIKEVDYFVADNNYDKGVEWYQSQFRGMCKAYGEASPNYSKAHRFKGVPRRMYSLLPNVKLIYLVRDPVERLVSHYTHNYSEGREHRSIIEVLESDWGENHYMMSSRYYWQLQHYLKFYAQDQIMIVFSEKLKQERRDTLKKIFRFIGVDETFYTEAYANQKHRTEQKRRKGKVSRYILERQVIKTLKSYVPDRVKDPIKTWTRAAVNKPELPPGLDKKLKEYFQPDLHSLYKLTNESVDDWYI